jgi:hypothetical protein
VDPNVADTVTITVRSTTETTPLSITLTETGPTTGIFKGSVQLAAGAATADSLLQVAHSDVITATFAGLNLNDTATVDAVAPTLSGLSANPSGTSAVITFTTDEPASSQVRYGTSPDSLNNLSGSSSLVTSHSVTLQGLQPGTTYYYQVDVLDAAANMFTSTINSFTTVAAAPILFVDDDMGANYERFFTAALTANSLAFDSWNVLSTGAAPTAANLAGYDIVIWNTGFDYSNPGAGLTATEQSAISSYLDGGGRIFISGQDVLYNGVSASFQQNYLKVAGFTNDVVSAAHTETGVVGNPITGDMSLAVAAPADFPSLYVDAVSPVAGASGLLQHGVTTTSPFSGVSYRGDYTTGGFGIVFSTVPFESISSTAAAPNNQNEFLKRTITFLSDAPSTPGIQVSSPSSTATTEAGGQSTFTVVLLVQPAADVTIAVSSSDTTEGSVSSESLVFTAANWNIPQVVTASGVNDAVDDGNVAWTVVLGAASSADAGFNGLEVSDVQLSNIDDDTAGVTVSAPTGTVTTESGDSVSFTVQLNSEPVGDVFVYVSSSDTTEGVVSIDTLSFNAANWNSPQTVTVTGVDDAVFDGNVVYTVIIPQVSAGADSNYNGLNPADISLTNNDNDAPPATKFYTVDDAAPDRTFEYAEDGSLIESYAINSTNSAPRGIATVAAGDRLWVVDAARRVFVYNNSGILQGSWTAGTLANNATVEGIATDGTHIWIVDARADRVYYYANAASRLTGSQTATASFLLTTGNAGPKDVVFGSQGGVNYLWVVNDAATDRVFRYTLNASGVSTGSASWLINSANSRPTGITVDPSNASMDIWISDNNTDRVYRYSNGRTVAAPALASSFALNIANGNVQGIADPPPTAVESTLSGYRAEVADIRTSLNADIPASVSSESAASISTQQTASSTNLISTGNTRSVTRSTAARRTTSQPAGLSRFGESTSAWPSDAADNSSDFVQPDELDSVFADLGTAGEYWLN